MPERRWPAREDIQELKEQGTVFRAPLSIRLVSLSAILGALIGSWSWLPDSLLPESLEALPSYFGAVGGIGIALCAASLLASVGVTLLCNGFEISIRLLRAGRRAGQRPEPIVVCLRAALGVACGLLLARRFVGELFLLLRMEGRKEVLSGVSGLGSTLSTTVIVGSIIAAILVGGLAWLRFLFVNRAIPGTSEQ